MPKGDSSKPQYGEDTVASNNQKLKDSFMAGLDALRQFRTKPDSKLLPPKPETPGSDAAKSFVKGFNK